jgi:RNA polymerase sigma-70 factor (ECF subfamily)
MFELNPDYSKRDCSLPPGCKDLIDVIRLEANWKTFFDSYWKLIYGVAIKAGLDDAEAQKVVQETIIAVAKQMEGFKYDPKIGSFKGWLLHTTRWRIADKMRKRRDNDAK